MSEGKKPLSQLQISIYEGKVCPYCKCLTKYVHSEVIYGKGIKDYGFVYYCQPCFAWVGCHKGTTDALGRLAKWDLRKAKKEAHAAFDVLWKTDLMSRDGAYDWLSNSLGIHRDYAHIGMFNVKTCNLVTDLSKKRLKELRAKFH